jgi:hypothetical protein
MGAVHAISPNIEVANARRAVTGILPIATILICRAGNLRHAPLKLHDFAGISVTAWPKLVA